MRNLFPLILLRTLFVVILVAGIELRVFAQDQDADEIQLKLTEELALPRKHQNDPTIESTVFDLFLSDKFRGSILVSYTDDWFEIDEPRDAIDQIPEFNARKESIIPLLTGRIDRERTVDGVGKISYDLSSFRIILEPDAAFLKASGLNLSRRVMSPASKFTLQQTLGVSAVHEDNGTSQSAFNHRSFASVGEIFARIDGTAVQNRPYEIVEATAGDIVGDYQVRGGLLQLRGQIFSPSLQFGGVQVETAEQIFLDDDLAKGSPLELFIPSRSTVEFYRDGRLLTIKVLDYGLQEVDTSSFPQGSYDVDIVIRESTGRETRDRRFFTKAGFLASRGHPVFSFSAGVVRNRLEFRDTPIGQAGVRYRLSDILDVGASLTGTDKTRIGTVALNGLFRGLRFGVGGARSDDDASGVQGSLGFPLLGGSIDARVTKTYGGTVLALTPTPTPSEPLLIPARSELREDITIQEQQSTSISASRAFGPVDLRFNIQRNKVGGDKARYTNGPSLDWRIKATQAETLTARSSYLATEIGTAKALQLLYRRRFDGNWAFDLQLLQRWQESMDESLILLGATYDSIRGLVETGSRIQLTSEARKLQEEDGDNRSLTNGVNADITSEYLKVVGFGRNINQSGRATNTVGVNAESAFLVSDLGHVAVAHPVSAETAFIAEVEGDALAKGVPFEVLIDGQIREILELGEHAVIGLAPYRTYKASIRPTEGASIVSYDTTVHEFSVFPGNVVKRVWHIDKIFIVLGRVVDEEGKPIAHERIKGTKDYSFTEEDGTFQAEVTGRETLYIDSRRLKCDLPINFDHRPEYYLEAGDVVCRPKITPTDQN